MELRRRRYRKVIVETVDGALQKRFEDIEESPYDEVPLYTSRVKANNTIYADRMRQWDRDKYEECCKKVWGCIMNNFYSVDSSEVEDFISLYLDKKVTLASVYTNQGYNGYDYYRFDYLAE